MAKSDDPGDAETASRDTAPIAARTPHTPRPTPEGWLGPPGAAIDHGQFEPGTVLNQRYRIASLLGRGGMGEVYRADDLRLGQPVALKFIRAPLASDPGRLARLHEEVRIARQVSHPNVCRVYDIGECEGRMLLRFGLLAGVACALASNFMSNAVFTLDPDRVYFAGSLLEAAVIVGVGLVGWRLARGRTS